MHCGIGRAISESHTRFAARKEPDREAANCDSVYVTFWELGNDRDRKWTGGCQGPGVGGRSTQGAPRNVLGAR